MNIEKVYQMEFGKIYPLLVNKATKREDVRMRSIQ